MPYSLKDAAEATGKSKPTILRAIQTGKVSAEKDVNGEWQIEPAELHRTYPPVPERTDTSSIPFNDAYHSNSPFEMGMLTGEVEQLREQLSALRLDRERERREASDNIEDLRKRLDQSEQERRAKDVQLTALLTDQSQADAAPAIPPPAASEVPASEATRLGWLARLGFWGNAGRK